MRNIMEVLKLPGWNPEANALQAMTASAFSVDSWRLHRDMGYIFTIECTSLTDLHYFSTYIPGLIWCCKPFLMCIYTEELFVFVWGDIHGLLRNWQNRS